ncbi:hypothetical protein [Vibrio agarivorans]|uniref:hypothetical protein n=1 Tax=Vibrio agarivorans TaxID=153622 RepID=UPI0025B41BB8|nr:hypothetical protein [Vibrio agarivorans]MDN3660444.1 hypothetical protein [Vibrio agarivorans]
MRKTLVSALVTSALISGCGGSDGDTNPSEPRTNISGRAIDGYIVGATVFYDFNGDKTFDPTMPYSITTEGGAFDIDISNLTTEQQSCLDYVPLIVDVPVGAVDEDLGIVKEPYTLRFPPTFVYDSDKHGESLNITPLSTVLWDSAARSVEIQKEEAYSCELVKNDESMKSSISSAMRTLTDDLVHNFNMSEEKLWSDYIASGHPEVYELAQDLMIAIRKSFDETLQLEQSHPDADVSVAYYINDPRNLNQASELLWYKSAIIDDGLNYRERVDILDDDWETVVKWYLKRYDINELHDFGTVGLRRYFTQHNDFSSTCTIGETIFTEDTPHFYFIENQKARNGTTLKECEEFGYSDMSFFNSTLLETGIRDLGINQLRTWYLWEKEAPSEYTHWTNFHDNLAGLDRDAFIADMSQLPLEWGNQNSVGSDKWQWDERANHEDGGFTIEHRLNFYKTMPNGGYSDYFFYHEFADGTFWYECTNGNGGFYDCTK